MSQIQQQIKAAKDKEKEAINYESQNQFSLSLNYQSQENSLEGMNLQDQQQMANNVNYEQQNQPLLSEFGIVQDLSTVDFKTRKKFIIKVYGILSIQILITFLLCLISYYSQGLRNLLINPNNYKLTPFYWICSSICFVTELFVICFKKVARKVPINYMALSIFTITFAFMIAGACAVSYDYYENGQILVIIAAFMTLVITVAVTIYAIMTKNDLTKLGCSFFIISTAMLMFLIFGIFYFNEILWIFLCAVYVIFYGFYLIHDTQLIIGGKSHQLSIDDYIIAVMLIYIDIFNIFLELLQILTGAFGKP